MVADIAGFSRLMERDESLTFARLRRLREEVTFPTIAEHGGRIVKLTGDGFLAEFGSAIAAVKCGIEIQRSVIELEAGQADPDRIQFRIGLNVGDIIIDGEDVAGDGVNIAARLETLSPLDGMCISSSVREQIRDDLGVGFEDMGEQTLRNIARPIRAYAVRFGSAIANAEQQAPPPSAVEPAPSLDHLVKFEIDFDTVLGSGGGANPEAANVPAGAEHREQRDAAEEALRQAAEQAAADAQATARREAEAEEKRGEEERRRRDELAQERQRAEDRAREQEHAKMQARLDAEHDETERHFAEMEKELEAEQAVAKVKQKTPPGPRQDARKRVSETMARVRAEAALLGRRDKAAAEAAPVVYRAPINWGKPVALGVIVILLLGLVIVHVVSFDRSIPQFEKLASAHLRQPVKIKALHLSLVPPAHWRLDGVSVGNEGQLTVASIDAVPELRSMFSDRKVFKSLTLESPALSEQGLFALLFGKPQGQDLRVASIIVKNGKFNSKTMILPALDAKIAMDGDGAWKKIALETPDHKTSLVLEPKSEGEGAQLELETNAFSLPFGPAFILENVSAKGVLGRDELRLSEFKGGIYGGFMSGNASLKWGAGWSLGGEISVRAMDPGRIVPVLLDEGKLEGKAVYAMRASSYEGLFAAPRLEGSFAVRKGSLLGVDLARLLHSGSVGGKTAFAELYGNFVFQGGETHLREVHLRAGPVSAVGNADADASKNIRGRLAVEFKSPVAQAHADMTVSGTLREPRFSR